MMTKILWHVESWSPLDGRFFVNNESSETVAEVLVTDPRVAALVAAAPEMFELLKAMTPCPECKMRGIPGTQKFHWPNCDNCIRAQALIDRIEKQ